MLVLLLALWQCRRGDRHRRHSERQRKMQQIFRMLKDDKELEYLVRKELQATPEQDVAFKNNDKSIWNSKFR